MNDEIKAMSSASGATGGYVLGKKDTSDGVMVAFRLPLDLGQQLLSEATDGGLPIGNLQPVVGLHVTLAYLGEADEQPTDEENVVPLLESFAAGWSTLSGSFNGVGRFMDASEHDVIYASFDSPSLPRFRNALLAYLKGAGLDVVETHGFTPHVTLAYVDKALPTPAIAFQPLSVTFDALYLVWRDDWYAIPFGGAAKAHQMTVSPATIEPSMLPSDLNSEGGHSMSDGELDEAAKAQDKKPHVSHTNVNDQMADSAYNASPAIMDDDATLSAEKDGDQYAYPEEKKLPIGDAEHVVLAAAALGPNPPHGHGADIPQDKLGVVKGRIRARAHELGLSKDQVARVNAYLSGHMPSKKMSDREVDAWQRIYEKALLVTGSDTKAALAAQGSLNRASVMGLKSYDDGLPATVEGWAVLFTDPDELDLQGTFFDEATRTLVEYYPSAPLWMEHGKDNLYGADPIGHRSAAQVFPIGIWLEHTLHRDHPLYARTARDAANGAFSYSSDSLSHYAAQGYDPGSGHLGEWPLAGCSLTRTPAEPGLGPVKAKSFEMALKSAVQERKASEAQDEAAASTSNNGELMDNKETTASGEGQPTDFIETETEIEKTPGTQLEVLAQMYGCDAEPEAVRSAMDAHIAQIQAEGKADAALYKALLIDDNTTPTNVIEHLNNLYGEAIQQPDDDSGKNDVLESTMAMATPNYDALKHLHSGGAAAKGKGPYMTGSIGQKGINVNKGLRVPGVAETLVDMIRVKNGGTPKYRWNSTKAMTSATGPTGGYVLRQEISDDILDPLRAQPVVFQLGARQEDMQGTNVKMVPAMQSAPASSWIGENQAVTTGQPAYRLVTLVPHGLQTTVQIPVNVEATMTPRAEKQLREQISLSQTLALDLAAMVGTGGAGQPVGILNTPGVRQMLLATNGRIPTFQDIVAANGLLDDSNVPQQDNKRGMAFHSKIERAFTGQTDTLGRPLIRETWGRAAEKELAGFPYRVSTQLSTTLTVGSTSNNSYVFFSDWRYLIVGLSDMVELRLSETFMNNLQVGLLAYVYVDIKAAYPEAFIVMTGAQSADISGVTVTTNANN